VIFNDPIMAKGKLQVKLNPFTSDLGKLKLIQHFIQCEKNKLHCVHLSVDGH